MLQSFHQALRASHSPYERARASITTNACASGVLVGDRQMDERLAVPAGMIAASRAAAPPVRCIVGWPDGRLTTPMSRQNTPRLKSGAERLGAGLLGREALGVGGGAARPADPSGVARSR